MVTTPIIKRYNKKLFDMSEKQLKRVLDSSRIFAVFSIGITYKISSINIGKCLLLLKSLWRAINFDTMPFFDEISILKRSKQMSGIAQYSSYAYICIIILRICGKVIFLRVYWIYLRKGGFHWWSHLYMKCFLKTCRAVEI